MDIQIRKIEDSIDPEMINAIKEISVSTTSYSPDIKGLNKFESQNYWKYILVHALYIHHEQELQKHTGIHLAVTLLGACQDTLTTAITKMEQACKFTPV